MGCNTGKEGYAFVYIPKLLLGNCICSNCCIYNIHDHNCVVFRSMYFHL